LSHGSEKPEKERQIFLGTLAILAAKVSKDMVVWSDRFLYAWMKDFCGQ
jgi:hypothetical protein